MKRSVLALSAAAISTLCTVGTAHAAGPYLFELSNVQNVGIKQVTNSLPTTLVGMPQTFYLYATGTGAITNANLGGVPNAEVVVIPSATYLLYVNMSEAVAQQCAAVIHEAAAKPTTTVIIESTGLTNGGTPTGLPGHFPVGIYNCSLSYNFNANTQLPEH